MMLREQSRRATQLLLIGLAATAFTGAASAAINYEFEASDKGGTGKAIMSFADTLNTGGNGNKFLTVSIDNISSTVLDSGSGTNSPGISALGFDIDDVNLLDWRLQALSSANGSLVTIGNSYGESCYGGSCVWSDSGGGGGFGPIGKNPSFQLEYIFGTSNGQGLLYNPDVTDGFGGSPHYFTKAFLTLEFDPSTASAVPTSTAAMRMMNVGRNGDGSITMTCTEGDDCFDDDNGGGGGGGEVPEPTGLALVALGLVGLRVTRRRENRR